MKNLLKKSLSLMLALIMALGALPLMPKEEVQAAAGEEFYITPSAGYEGAYDLSFTFNKPTSNINPTTRVIVGYNIYYRNQSRNDTSASPPLWIPSASADTNPATISGQFPRVYLAYGSLYTFQVKTVYNVATQVGGNTVWREQEEGDYIANFAALTDIRVEAIGVVPMEGGSGSLARMTVTWEYPNLPGNSSFFTGYNIYVANITGDQRPLNWGNVVAGGTIPESAVSKSFNPATGEATGSYTFSHDDLHIGNIYAVRVEPVWNGVERLDLSREVPLGNLGTFNFRSSRNDYFTDKGYIRPNIIIEETTLTSLDIVWENNNLLRDSLSGKRYSGSIASIEVWQVRITDTGEWLPSRLNIISGDNVAMNTRASIARPSGSASYYIVVNYNGIQYVPPRSSTPVTAYPVSVYSIEATYAPGAMDFAPYRPDILSISDNRKMPLLLNIDWKAFYRKPYTSLEIEKADYLTGMYIDKDVTYEIAITDNPDNFGFMRSEHMYMLNGANLTLVPGSNGGQSFYSEDFDKYYSRSTNSLVAIEQNKIYYVMIRAIRNATSDSSKASFDSYYVMPIGRIPTDPNTIAKPPLRIKTEIIDGVRTEAVGETSITIEWDEQWFEIYKPSDGVDGGKWYSKAGFVNGTLVYGDTVEDDNNILYKSLVYDAEGFIDMAASKDAIRKALTAGGVSGLKDTVLRMQDITGCEYRINVSEYEEIAETGYDEYYEDLVSAGIDSWAPVQYDTVTAIKKEYTVTGLRSGTPYAIFLWPYFISTADYVACHPSYVSATTLIKREDPSVTPTVPVLIGVGKTDTTIIVKWKYSPELVYTLGIDEFMSSYPSGGRTISNEEILEKSSPVIDPVTGESFITFVIEELFPNTQYYIWLGAASDSSGEERWSNPIEMKTDDLLAPPPPKSLGLASNYSVETYNKENGTSYKPSDYDYIIAEWIRINADINNQDPSEEEGAGAGEGAGEGEGGGNAEYLPNPTIIESYMVKFNQLTSNKIYYIRAKTRLVVTKNADVSISRSYSYIVQISADEGFVDYVEIEVPISGDIALGIYKDSEWVSVTLKSDKSGSEYDGDKDPEMYPLPETDFEISYDNTTGTLTYRFRSNGKDSSGNNDNQVDERFISRLVANRTFEYYIDLSTYQGRTPRNRVVEFPYSIISAFNERKIGLKLKAGDYTVSFPYGSFSTAELGTLTGLNKNSKLSITITQNPEGIVAATDTNYISARHKLSANVATTAANLNIVNFAKPLNMNLALSGVYVEGMTNVGAYAQDGNTAGWQRLNASFDTITKSLNFTSQRAASYSAIGLVTPWSETQAATLNQMYAVNSKLSITDMGYYNENNPINVAQFNQIMAACLKGSPTVAMNTGLSSEDYNSLGKAKLLISGTGSSPVSREAGISAMVKLFEIKTKYPVTGYPSLSETGYNDIAYASEQYRTPLLKAVELGFYRGASADPRGNLSFGDCMHMLSIILFY